MTTPAYDAFQQKFRVPELTIKRFQHWTWSVRPMQVTLGSTVISLNRPATAWGETDAKEGAELVAVVGEVERRLKGAFGYEKINYLMLMMVDEHVHFHVLPRYSKTVSFQGRDWVDAAWPKPPDLSKGETANDLLEGIRAALSK